MTCEKCGKLITSDRDAEVHHVIELTPDNVNDATISLNPSNVELTHHACHNKEHGRFGHAKAKQVFLVYGCPGAGKEEYVRRMQGRTDIVACMDSLYESITGLRRYDKPDCLLTNVKNVYNLLLDQIKTRYGKWSAAWVIGGYADKYQREKLADELGAELIYCECEREEAMARVVTDDRRRNMAAEYRKYIDEWFERYTQ